MATITVHQWHDKAGGLREMVAAGGCRLAIDARAILAGRIRP
jgi:hypothetical protein